MAHGLSCRPLRRAAWLVVACSLATGCTGPDKEPLDPATKQKLLGLAPPPGAKTGTGNATVDQRFNRTTPIRLPDPQLTTTPPPAQPVGGGGLGTQPVGLVSAPTVPGGNPAVMRPQPAEPVNPVGFTQPAPVALDPVQPLPPTGGLPAPGGAGFPSPGGPALPPAPPAPLSNGFDLPPAPAPSPVPGPVMPGPSGPLAPVPGFGDGPTVPPLVK